MPADEAARLWDIEDLAAYLKTSVGAVYYLRHQRKGPPACKVGRELRWDPAVVRRWLSERTESATQPAPVNVGRPGRRGSRLRTARPQVRPNEAA